MLHSAPSLGSSPPNVMAQLCTLAWEALALLSSRHSLAPASLVTGLGVSTSVSSIGHCALDHTLVGLVHNLPTRTPTRHELQYACFCEKYIQMLKYVYRHMHVGMCVTCFNTGGSDAAPSNESPMAAAPSTFGAWVHGILLFQPSPISVPTVLDP